MVNSQEIDNPISHNRLHYLTKVLTKTQTRTGPPDPEQVTKTRTRISPPDQVHKMKGSKSSGTHRKPYKIPIFTLKNFVALGNEGLRKVHFSIELINRECSETSRRHRIFVSSFCKFTWKNFMSGPPDPGSVFGCRTHVLGSHKSAFFNRTNR